MRSPLTALRHRFATLKTAVLGDAVVRDAIEFLSPYDWGQFTLSHFLDWLSSTCHRKFVVVPWNLPPNITGGWVTSNDCEFFIYAEGLSETHKTHVVLHEVGHWLMAHRTINLDHLNLEGCSRSQILNMIQLQMLNRTHVEDCYEERRERQAESFATTLTTRIIELNPTILSEELKPFKIEIS